MKNKTVLTAHVPEVIRGNITDGGYSLGGDDITDVHTLMRVLKTTPAEFLVVHMSVAEALGRKRFFREIHAQRPDVYVIAIGSRSDRNDEKVKAMLKDRIIAALVEDSRKLAAEIKDALWSVQKWSKAEEEAAEAMREEAEADYESPRHVAVEQNDVDAYADNAPEREKPPDPYSEPGTTPKTKSKAENPQIQSEPVSKPERITKPKLPAPRIERAPKTKQVAPPPTYRRPPKPATCAVICVFEALSGGGCTWMAAALASWLADNGLRAALLGGDDLRYLPPRESPVQQFEYNGVDVFCGGETVPEVIRRGYDYIVADLGAIVRQSDGSVLPTQQREKYDEITRASRRIFVADAGRTRWPSCASVMALFSSMDLDMSTAVTRASPDVERAIKKLAKGSPFATMPIIPDPFERTGARDNFCATLFFSSGGGNHQ